MNLVNLLVIFALIATIVVLVMGLSSMSRGGEYDEKNSEKFMWERINGTKLRRRVLAPVVGERQGEGRCCGRTAIALTPTLSREGRGGRFSLVF